jgi:hypothetical protein
MKPDLERGEVLTWTVENAITTVMMAIVGMAIIATITAKPQATGEELERALPRPRDQPAREQRRRSSSRPGSGTQTAREPLPGARGRGGDLGSWWMPQAGAMVLPARDLVGARDIRDAIMEARETYE